ncbi:MMPL family transporter [Mumia zhuanghuii]|uniref:MMPL family transporter n=2 Tax=Mumia TaxID=1546255 RepID=A0ABW1QJM2_9ACTN|nr:MULTISPECIES: MMPL family transporter [Mumia]KAA1425392.1 MMPL family transporter [Mumia zhuanghuii]
MSLFLYRLGGLIAARRGTVVAAWFLVIVTVMGTSAALGDQYDDAFSVPGTQSQEGQDLLADRFGQTGTSGQLLVTATAGKITDSAPSTDVAEIVEAVGKVPGVAVSNPLTATDPVVSQDQTATLASIRFDDKVPSESTLGAVERAAEPPSSAVTTSVGGDAYKPDAEPSRVPELIGLFISFVILAVTFGSLLAAGMPVVTSLFGVLVTLSTVVIASWLTTVSSTAPTLAEMLGLAVGIDYALFILSRHRRHLAEGLDPPEAMRRAMATAGSAVVFAGATVIIALTGLAVARIPVLTVMGVAAALAVAVAVTLALTLLPAIALLFGERLRPRQKRSRRRQATRQESAGTPFSARWVAATTRFPAVTILVVLVLLILAARPASELELALPDNSTAPPSSAARETYDDITATFGEGYNAPLSVTADVITSSDPTDTVNDLAAAIAKVPDVVDITLATPNEGGDTALIQVIPSAGQTAPSTKALVETLRAMSPGWEKQLGVGDIMVTGQTAINIDVSDRLAAALLPFAVIVIGLSLLLLMVVFRSIAVPLKATVGYLLSVGAALGAVVVVFQWGWLGGLGEETGPVVSFMPIFVMGVLFGLAMDYEMFLVSAMREEYVRAGDPQRAVRVGFVSSARVVTAAALIMGTVFIAFIPGGSSTIKPIALGLAVGVFVDAFVVRMTLVPAVMVLLGRRAWWLPAVLDRSIPDVDVEGAVLHRKIAFQEWESEHGEVAVLARDLVVREGDVPVEITARPGEVHRLALPASNDAEALAYVLTGRSVAHSGILVVDGLLLPEQREAVSRSSTGVRVGAGRTDVHVDELLRDRARVVTASRRGRREFVARATDAVGALGGDGSGVDGAGVDAATAVAAGARLVVLHARNGDAASTAQADVDALAAALAEQGATVIVTVPQETGRLSDG